MRDANAHNEVGPLGSVPADWYQLPEITIHVTECSEFVLNAAFERRRVQFGGRNAPTLIRRRVLRSRVLGRVQ